jgi:Cu/Ag efflux protein CusF
MKSAWIAALLGALALPVQAPLAQGAAVTKAASVMYEGQVRRVNVDARRVTLAHGPLKAFEMPAMTMAFPVKDPKQLAGLKEGDKVRFALEPSGQDLVITRIEAVR